MRASLTGPQAFLLHLLNSNIQIATGVILTTNQVSLLQETLQWPPVAIRIRNLLHSVFSDSLDLAFRSLASGGSRIRWLPHLSLPYALHHSGLSVTWTGHRSSVLAGSSSLNSLPLGLSVAGSLFSPVWGRFCCVPSLKWNTHMHTHFCHHCYYCAIFFIT